MMMPIVSDLSLQEIEIYQKIILDEMSIVINQKKVLTNEYFNDSMINTIMGIESDNPTQDIYTDKEKFIANKLFKGFSEIFHSKESLKRIQIYLRHFPYQNIEISEMDYIKYHIENYLNEVYILKERMISYNTSIVRSYQKSANYEVLKARLGESSKVTSETLKNLTTTRSNHVHSERYSDLDTDRIILLDSLSTIEGKDGETYKNLLSGAYKDLKDNWLDIISKNQTAINELLNTYCNTLIISISKDGKVIYPTNTLWS